MYSYFEGELKEKTPAYAVIDCNGVGYMLNITLNTYTAIKDKQRCRLLAHLVVREDALTLFGFATGQELELFRKLISVSGVGPGTARMVLSSVSAEDVYEAIVNGNVSVLKAIKGIGEKTAQRIIVDLRGRMPELKGKGPLELGGAEGSFLGGEHNIKHREALSALMMLGFAKNPAEKALDKIFKSADASASVEEIIKHALQIL
jgi:Holliday junction DNA helicase RuvA